jgi:hypothetical protein
MATKSPLLLASSAGSIGSSRFGQIITRYGNIALLFRSYPNIAAAKIRLPIFLNRT